MNEKNKSGNSFLVQGSILAAAAIIAKVIGMLYRVPLQNILENEGNGYYSTANEIYAILLMVSCFNMPLAVSRLVSERIHKGEYRNAHRVFLCAVRFSMLLGGVIALITYICAGFITKYMMSMELAVYGLRVLAPAIFISAILGTFRGYFQGFGTMVPTAVSQVIEQIINAVISLVCADIMFRYGDDLAAVQGNASLAPAWGAAGATFGTVASITVALLFMMIIYMTQSKSIRRHIRQDHTGHRESASAIYGELIRTILPVILSTVVYNITNVLDLGVFSNVLQSQGYTDTQTTTIWGIYSGQFRVLMNVPLALASSLSPSVVPSLTAAMANNDRKEARRKVSTSIRFTMLLTIPCAAGMAALAEPIITMLFTNETGTPLSVGIMQAGALMIIFYALSTLTTGILQGLGQMRQPLIHCCISLVIHMIALYILLTTFSLNIYAVVGANIIFAIIICILNSISISIFLVYRQEI
ncbi:MAG: polysaccharide biosynthesis protein [Clostridiales bacterium]|nr:polysaccharide biosynthesis protein [Clostridiales bacterium]